MAAMGEAAPTGPVPDPSGHESAPPVPELPALLWKMTAPEGEPGPVEIDIIVLHGGEKSVVRCPSESTFVSLKMGIQEATGLPSAHQRLIFNKKQRKDAESFAEAGVAHQSKVRLLYSDQFALTREGKAELSGVADEVSQLEEEIPRAVRQAEQLMITLTLTLTATPRPSSAWSIMLRSWCSLSRMRTPLRGSGATCRTLTRVTQVARSSGRRHSNGSRS